MATTTMRAEVRQVPLGIAGDYSAIVVDPSGAFHPFWVDNRGDAAKAVHLFTTSITVAGGAHRNGSAELAALDNVTSKVELQYHYTKTKWEAGYLNVDVGLVLRNVSSDTIVGTLKYRILGVRSLGGPVILRATGASAAGAVLDLTSAMTSGRLVPGASTKIYEIRLRAGPAPADLAGDGPYGLGAFNVKILGQVLPASPGR
jgi:hypothetical protein